MQRLVATLLGAVLASTAGHATALHTHAYVDHDHPEHHHGLAAHEHHHEPAHREDGTARLEGCDPGQHTISFAFVCAASLQVQFVAAEIASPATLTPEPAVEVAVGYTDVRVHGPPVRALASPRAPPFFAHA